MHYPEEPELLKRIGETTGVKLNFKDPVHKNYAASYQDGRLYQVRITCPYVTTLMAYDTVKQDWTFHSGPPCDMKAYFNAIFMGHLPPEVSKELSVFPTVIFKDNHPNVEHGPFKKKENK